MTTTKTTTRKTAKPAPAPTPPEAAPPAAGPQAKGKLGILLALLRRPDGATLAEMGEATGWQAHSVRGAMAGSLKKKLGLAITSEKPGNERIYRIAAAAPAAEA